MSTIKTHIEVPSPRMILKVVPGTAAVTAAVHGLHCHSVTASSHNTFVTESGRDMMIEATAGISSVRSGRRNLKFPENEVSMNHMYFSRLQLQVASKL